MNHPSPLVTVIVTTHLDENAEYLRLCLWSISQSEGVPFETIVVSGAPSVPIVPDGMTAVHDPLLNTGDKKINRGIALSDPNSKYFLIVSDDVMLTKHTMAGLVRSVGDQRVIAIPSSNGDNGSQFATSFQLTKEGTNSITTWELPLHLNAEDVQGWEEAIRDFPLQRQLMVVMDYVTFFCPLIPRKVWEQVGELDPRLHTRHNDQDYCYRAREKNIPSVIDFSVFALHFGSKTLNIVAPESERNAASKVFWDKQRSKIQAQPQVQQ